MSQPDVVILVRSGQDRIIMFDVSQNLTGYIFCNLVKQEFTFNFDPLDDTKNVADAIFKKEVAVNG